MKGELKMKLNDSPERYALSRAEIKKGLFSKKEVIKYALGDEDQNALTEYDYDSIEPFSNGFARAAKKNGRTALLDLNGGEVLKEFTDRGYAVYPENGYFSISRGALEKGLASPEGKVLIDPKKGYNRLDISGDIVIYGRTSTVSQEYNEYGIGRLEDGELKSVVPFGYSFAAFVDGRVVAAGRCVVSTQREIASLTRDRVITTARAAFQLYSADTGKISDLVFGELRKTEKGNYSGTVYPNIAPEELTHRQTAGEAFSGAGLPDFSKKKNIVLDKNFAPPG